MGSGPPSRGTSGDLRLIRSVLDGLGRAGHPRCSRGLSRLSSNDVWMLMYVMLFWVKIDVMSQFLALVGLVMIYHRDFISYHPTWSYVSDIHIQSLLHSADCQFHILMIIPKRTVLVIKN